MADGLAKEADFLSIGSNDLAQYTLAMDRTNPLLAASIDALHPAVLRLIAMTAEAGRSGRQARQPVRQSRIRAARRAVARRLRHPRAFGGAGGAARVRSAIRQVSASDCRALAKRALDAESAAEVRALAAELLNAPAQENTMIQLRVDKLQPLGRALMLPIAVLPIAGLLLRLGQPDLLNLAVRRRGRRRDLLASWAAVRDWRRRRSCAGEPRRGRAGRRSLLLRADGGRQGAASGHARSNRGLHRPGGQGPGDSRVEGEATRQAERSGRHPFRCRRGHALQPVQRHQAAGLSRLLRRAALRADRRGRGRAVGAVLFGLGLPPSKAASTSSAAGSSPRAASACSSMAS